MYFLCLSIVTGGGPTIEAQYVRDLNGRTFSQTLLKQARKAWMRWLRTMHDDGETLVWRGKADQTHVTELARMLGIPVGDVRSHRIGRPPGRWEDVPVEVWGSMWFDTADERDMIPLADAIKATPPARSSCLFCSPSLPLSLCLSSFSVALCP